MKCDAVWILKVIQFAYPAVCILTAEERQQRDLSQNIFYIPEHCEEATLRCHSRLEWSRLCYRWVWRPIAVEFGWVFGLHGRWRWSLVLCRHNECTQRPCWSYNPRRYLFCMGKLSFFLHILVVSYGFWVKVGCVEHWMKQHSSHKTETESANQTSSVSLNYVGSVDDFLHSVLWLHRLKRFSFASRLNKPALCQLERWGFF